ncbi:hypothetical protein NHX12_005149 [Muraenolepis orangiensis]|uniref:Uncharacterized protein n=1 Tax=Muraenolepis orangiensis TaxID=630683 RepID=A0A9Q0IC22_9TELE|nr:hypothetical protein NHX12_005149 [Muraenolepis orangiensis]
MNFREGDGGGGPGLPVHSPVTRLDEVRAKPQQRSFSSADMKRTGRGQHVTCRGTRLDNNTPIPNANSIRNAKCMSCIRLDRWLHHTATRRAAVKGTALLAAASFSSVSCSLFYAASKPIGAPTTPDHSHCRQHCREDFYFPKPRNAPFVCVSYGCF